MNAASCRGCGLEIADGTRGCLALFEDLLALEFGNALYFGVHRLTVDTYSMQHPDPYCESAISLAAHLTGLCAAIEHDDAASTNARVQRWLSTRPVLDKPALPAARGALTIADVDANADPAAYAGAIRRWARATWDAHAELHAIARAWIERATT